MFLDVISDLNFDAKYLPGKLKTTKQEEKN